MANCIICLETNCKRICDVKYIKIHDNCICDYMIHDDCLRQWLATKQECLICHCAIVYRTSNYEILKLFVCSLVVTVVVSVIVLAIMIGKLILFSVAALFVCYVIQLCKK